VAVSSAVVNNGLHSFTSDSSCLYTWPLWPAMYWQNSTNHKQGATKLLKLVAKHLLMVTIDSSKNYLTGFKISNNGRILH